MNYCNPEGWRNEVKKLRDTVSREKFFTYFDGPKDGSVDDVFIKAEDVFTRLMMPHAKMNLDDIKNRISLDIGFGTGGQVAAASKYFKLSVGVDVHEERDIIEDELSKRTNGNFQLISTDGLNTPFDDNFIDFIHSWVTFIHMQTIVDVKSYLKECFRILKPGGVGIIYFGRLIRSGKNQSWVEVLGDIKKEEENTLGYREGGPLSKVKSVTLVISMWKMKSLLKEVGFKVLEYTASFDGEGDGKIYHGQYGVVFAKPKPKPEIKQRRKFMAKK